MKQMLEQAHKGIKNGLPTLMFLLKPQKYKQQRLICQTETVVDVWKILANARKRIDALVTTRILFFIFALQYCYL